MRLARVVSLLPILALMAFLLRGGVVALDEESERVRAFTRQIEFDYASWTLNAVQIKLEQAALGLAGYLGEGQQSQIVLDYLDLVKQIQDGEAQLSEIYANPEIANPEQASWEVRQRLDSLYRRRSYLGPLAESILQAQVSRVVAELGLTLGGQPLPPVLYHSTPLPLALIVSPRNVIRQDHNISLSPDLTLDQQVALEEQVDRALNVSSLVVRIGGVGVYPTMVMQTNDLNWLSEVVAHEWIHNYLTLRPLGLNYERSPELRTMNETAATIAGKEIGRALMERFYPQLVPPPPPTPMPGQAPSPAEPPAFDFNKEMHLTRVTVDELLAKGQIEEAEAYMEQRRVFFWEHGYRIRKLNQAYFAFYGAYADQPGGAAGEDPVGAAVRALRAQSPTLADFIRRIAWMSSYEQLKRAIAQGDLIQSPQRGSN